MKAIIPTGGRGTRMQPLTFSTNKHFIPVANKPLIFYPIETVADAGIKDIAITYNPGWLDTAKQYLGNGEKWGLNITYVLQDKPMGLANIFQVCEEYLAGESFFLHLGDNIFADGIKDLVNHFEKEKPDGLVAMVHHKENTRLGVPYFDETGKMVKYVEKPKNPPHDFAIPGIYFFSNTVFKCFKGEDAIKPSERGEYEISSPYQWLIDHGYRVNVLEYKGKWLDPGKFDDWMEANRYLLEKNTRHVKDHIAIGKNSLITNTQLTGPIVIGDNVEISSSQIGPFTAIGDDCVVKESQVKNSILMSGVKLINVPKPIDESLIGSDSEIRYCEGAVEEFKFFIGEKCQIKV